MRTTLTLADKKNYGEYEDEIQKFLDERPSGELPAGRFSVTILNGAAKDGGTAEYFESIIPSRKGDARQIAHQIAGAVIWGLDRKEKSGWGNPEVATTINVEFLQKSSWFGFVPRLNTTQGKRRVR
jgi:hypothetical protein